MTKLQELLQVISKKVVFIQTHNNPDQDALATAHGLKVLLEHFGKQAIVCYKGEIDKYNTIKMIELLKFDITPAESIEFRPDDETILVDCQKGNSNVKAYRGKVIACIDHHELQDTSSYLFHDIRPEIGACATIMASYFMENAIPIDRLMATSLLYAIRIDTNALSRSVTDLDLETYTKLHKLADQEILKHLDSCNLKLRDLSSYHYAIENLRIYQTIALVDLGENCPEAIAGQISDFILTLREVDFVLSHTYRENGVKFSARSSKNEIDASEVIRKALKDFGDGGGHRTMAAGFVPNVATANAAQAIASIAEDRVIHSISEQMHFPVEKKGRHRRFKQAISIWNSH